MILSLLSTCTHVELTLPHHLNYVAALTCKMHRGCSFLTHSVEDKAQLFRGNIWSAFRVIHEGQTARSEQRWLASSALLPYLVRAVFETVCSLYLTEIELVGYDMYDMNEWSMIALVNYYILTCSALLTDTFRVVLASLNLASLTF